MEPGEAGLGGLADRVPVPLSPRLFSGAIQLGWGRSPFGIFPCRNSSGGPSGSPTLQQSFWRLPGTKVAVDWGELEKIRRERVLVTRCRSEIYRICTKYILTYLTNKIFVGHTGFHSLDFGGVRCKSLTFFAVSFLLCFWAFFDFRGIV